VTLAARASARAALVVLVALALAGCTKDVRAPGPPPSLLLVTVDTLRADRVGAYGDALARTPHMDALARGGVLFARAYTPAPLTLPAHATLLTGLLPPQHGVRGNGGFALGSQVPTLGEALRMRGLRTGAFVGGFPLERRFGLARGFDHYDDALDRQDGVHFDFAERRADRVVEAAREWLAGQSGPVFAWVHLFDPHAPYDPPADFRGGLDAYRGEIAFVDRSLGSLLAAWDARPGPSFVALTADHGEAFGEHGEESHSLFVYDTTLHVPLVLRGPGLVEGRRVTTSVGLADVAFTLLARLDATAGLAGSLPAPVLPGRDLLDEREAPLYAETLSPRLDFGWSDLRALRDGRYKYVRAPRPELYDVEADPGETKDLAAREPAVRERLSGALEATMARLGEESARRVPDAAATERLRALGYVQGPGGAGSGADPKDKIDVARRIARATGPFSGHEEAARVYADIARLDPDNPLVNLRLADALLRGGRARDAIAPFRKVVAGGPTTVDAHVGLATTYAQLGRMGEARAVLEAALRIDAANGQVQFNLGELSRAAGDVAEARRRYEAARADPITASRAEERLRALGR
jgi:arylsulfatase A-like enzyme